MNQQAMNLKDTGICDICSQDLFDPFNRRYRFPLIHCLNCKVTKSSFHSELYQDNQNRCPECESEYNSPSSRYFKLTSHSCYQCGPQLQLIRSDQKVFSLDSLTQLDQLDAIYTLLKQGNIVSYVSSNYIKFMILFGNADKAKTLLKTFHNKVESIFLIASTETLLNEAQEKEKKEELYNLFDPNGTSISISKPLHAIDHLVLKRSKLPLIVLQLIQKENSKEVAQLHSDYILFTQEFHESR